MDDSVLSDADWQEIVAHLDSATNGGRAATTIEELIRYRDRRNDYQAQRNEQYRQRRRARIQAMLDQVNPHLRFNESDVFGT